MNEVQERGVVDRLVSNTLSDRAFEQLEAAIVSGKLSPGEKLREATLARDFGISRGPLREALGRLEGKGLVERTAHLGPRVVSLASTDLVELFFVREALEGMACRLAAERMSASDIDQLERLLDEQDRLLQAQHKIEPADTRAGYFQQSGDSDFHFRIANASGNKNLTALLLGDLYSLLRLYRYRSSRRAGRADAALDEHRAIVAALRTRDPGLAEAAMRSHIQNSRNNLIVELKEDGEAGSSE